MVSTFKLWGRGVTGSRRWLGAIGSQDHAGSSPVVPTNYFSDWWAALSSFLGSFALRVLHHEALAFKALECGVSAVTVVHVTCVVSEVEL